MYKITMEWSRKGEYHIVDMSFDHDLGLLEAVEHCEIYKKRDASKIFKVIDKENGDIEYIV